jgi:hypothetical protein
MGKSTYAELAYFMTISWNSGAQKRMAYDMVVQAMIPPKKAGIGVSAETLRLQKRSFQLQKDSRASHAHFGRWSTVEVLVLDSSIIIDLCLLALGPLPSAFDPSFISKRPRVFLERKPLTGEYNRKLTSLVMLRRLAAPSLIRAARSRRAPSAPSPADPRHLSIRKNEFNVHLGCAHRIEEKIVTAEKGLAVLVIGTLGVWMV